MTGKSTDLLAATPDVAEAAQMPTVIDVTEFDRQSLDRCWREFCRDADRYVVETTRRPRSPS